MNTASRERWASLWAAAKLAGAGGVWYDRLVELYSQPRRHYHTLQHISECLGEFYSARSEARDALAVDLAIWFHDTIYNPRASDNEERSAELSRECLISVGATDDLVTAVSALVLDTKSHVASSHPDSLLMIDIDLAILGQPAARFDEYERQIREEYSWVPKIIFRPKRSAILRGFLERPRIYNTEAFFGKYEQSARANIKKALKQL